MAWIRAYSVHGKKAGNAPLWGAAILLSWVFITLLAIPAALGSNDETRSSLEPPTIVSLIVPPLYATIQGFREVDVYAFGAVPLMIESPLSRTVGLRLLPQVIFQTGKGNPTEALSAELSLVLPWYFRDRDDAWSFRGGYAGPAVSFNTYFSDSASDGTFGGELGYGWQSDNGTFLLLGFAIGMAHRFQTGVDHGTTPDYISSGLHLIIGYRLT